MFCKFAYAEFAWSCIFDFQYIQSANSVVSLFPRNWKFTDKSLRLNGTKQLLLWVRHICNGKWYKIRMHWSNCYVPFVLFFGQLHPIFPNKITTSVRNVDLFKWFLNKPKSDSITTTQWSLLIEFHHIQKRKRFPQIAGYLEKCSNFHYKVCKTRIRS